MNTKRMTSILPVLSLFLLIALATEVQATTYGFKSLDAPGASSTYAQSINASGQAAGYYKDASGTHGFVYSASQFTSLDAPGARETYAQSINASGQVAGHYLVNIIQGFVYSGDQFTSIPDVYQQESESVYAYSINDSGQVAGAYYYVSRVTDLYIGQGFVYSAGEFTVFDVPGASKTSATSINDRGQVAGYYEDASGTHGFVYSASQFTSLDAPGARETYAQSINASGQVAGYYWDDWSHSHSHGFVYSGGQVTSLDVPEAAYTEAYSINDRGQVTGYYQDASGTHGFVYSAGQFTSLDAPGARGTYAQSINASGQVAGHYEDASGTHGFIATPMTPFSAFNVTQLLIDQNRGALALWFTFTLGKDSNGINPVREEITLKIANATMTIPAGGFHHQSLFDFAGQIDNVWIGALIKTLGSNRFAFQALAYGAPLGDTKNPVTIELTIGDDRGTTTATAQTP